MRRWMFGVAAVPLLVVLPMPLMMVNASNRSTSCAVPALPASEGFSAEQMSIAKAATQLADQRKLPARAKLVILVTGFQESGIRNLTYGDRDSVGWLQQRPSQGWGTVAQIMDPAYGAGKFYDALVKVPGWQGMPVTVAAQAVQVSGYPDAYAKWEASARALLAVLGDTSAADCATDAAGNPKGGGPVPATFDKQGNPRTVEQAIAWMQRSMPSGAPGEPVLNACERYMNLSYGIGGGYPTALAHWAAPGPRTAGMSTPPRGALVFWRSGNPAGHVALSLGNGQVISTDFDGRSYRAGVLHAGPVTAIDKWGPRLGWRAPNFREGSEAS
jgi:hypothetical protein